MRIGLISDTHGLIRAEALQALDGVDVILHAGDVGGSSVLYALERIAPVYAVYGNTDPIDGLLPAHIDGTWAGLRVHVSHGHELGSPTPEKLVKAYDADVIIYGHTHRPRIDRMASALVINPGAAGPRRFELKPSVGILDLPALDIRLIDL